MLNILVGGSRTLSRWVPLVALAVALTLGGGSVAPAWAQGTAINSGLSSYALGAGDVISIRVLGEDDFTKEKIRLTDAGTIFFPSVGEIRINGTTLGELERIITNGLRGRILVNPRVSVEINEYRPFFITGMVKNPGSFAYQPGLTVRKAASLAGGFEERASLKKIFVIRERDTTQTSKRVELDSSIGPGDLITVEESFF
ncbi:polysaccharide biosynthesis/export family protein [Hydrogenophaga sp.]|uniref:polysaccharide biosynthesis/export family protein n=1 Tax=Hydrogenophaga sp. TaxID=1904254 RepID=UPI0025C61AD0|nr:polysaccharide biosynthesis/export family protein [Hydrogenophaga sp.]